MIDETDHKRLHVYKSYSSSDIACVIASGTKVVTGFTFEDRDPGIEGRPSFMLSRAEAIQLMTDLWDLGFRPSFQVEREEPSDIQPMLEAKDAHLADLRRILNRLLPGEPATSTMVSRPK